MNNAVNVGKIISGVEHCVVDNCKGCPYRNDMSDCLEDLLRDVREALKSYET